MSLSDAMKKLKFDSRLSEFNVKNGIVSDKELQDHLSKLEDVAHNAEKMELHPENGEDTSQSQH